MNKTRLFILGLAVASLLASCKKGENTNTAAEGPGFKAVTEHNGDGSRTYLDGVDVKWMEGDAIRVANADGASLEFEITEGDSTMYGTFYNGGDHETFFQPDYTALYPSTNAADVANTIDEDGIATFNLPATQALTVTGTFANKAMPMVAHSGTETLPFKNVLGGLVIPLVGDGLPVTSVVLTSLETTDKLWGVYTADCNSDNPVPAHVSGGSNQLTLSCDVTLDADTPNDFIFMVPPGTLSKGFKVEVFEGTTKLYEKTVDWSATPEPGFIPRSVLRKVNSSLEVICPCSLGPAGFTVGMDGDTPRRVFLAPGNLQYQASTNTWRFAEHQWDHVGTQTPYLGSAGGTVSGSDNHDISSSYNGWIDLFGWGTSGWNNGNYFYQPYSSSNSMSSPYTYSNGYGYGPTDGSSYTYSLTGAYANADWGVYNAIYNPKTNTTDPAGTWRTPTKDEGTYIILTRTTCSGVRFAMATVNNVPGMIIVPDNWDVNTYALNGTNTTNAAFTVNTISSADWTNIFEPAGCAFLPAAGFRSGSLVSNVGTYGNYWWATYANSADTYSLVFFSGFVEPRNYYVRLGGRSVRLVRSAE